MIKQKKKKKIRWSHALPMYLMVLPGLIYMVCNNYIPMFGIIIAFKKYSFRKGLLGSEWVGLDNFKYLFTSDTASTIIRNTIGYNVIFMILGTVIPIAVAILLNEITRKKLQTVYQTIILLPFLISWVVVSYLVFAFLSAENGFFNSILNSFGMESINWYMEPKYWPFILIFVNVWKGTGYSVIVYMASLVGISQEYYEAAKIDGASKWHQVRYITLPLLKPTVITLTVMSIGRIFASDFGLFYQIPKNSGALYSTTQTIDVFVYNALMRNSDYGMSSAASVFQSVVGFALVLITNAIVRKYHRDSALF